LTFKPITDGQKKSYYLNGQLSGQGEIKNKKENGLWTYWHENGQKAREGSFDEGKRTGTHTYWYPNGNVRGVGSFKNDKYDGKWTMHKEDGSETILQRRRIGETKITTANKVHNQWRGSV
jgi:antitoxin component YwqK of YwqJK toxin-antitoxin module